MFQIITNLMRNVSVGIVSGAISAYKGGQWTAIRLPPQILDDQQNIYAEHYFDALNITKQSKVKSTIKYFARALINSILSPWDII
jgi:hypothetical protein